MGIALMLVGAIGLIAGVGLTFNPEEESAIRQVVYMNIAVAGSVIFVGGAVLYAIDQLPDRLQRAIEAATPKPKKSCAHDFLGSPARCRFCGVAQPR